MKPTYDTIPDRLTTHTFDMRKFEAAEDAYNAFLRAAAVLHISDLAANFAEHDGVFVRILISPVTGTPGVEVGIVVKSHGGMIDIDADIVRERLDIIDRVVAARDHDLVQAEISQERGALRN